MMQVKKLTLWMILASMIVALPTLSWSADDKDKAAKQQERRMRQLMQQVQAEKEQLQNQFEQDKAKLQQETEAEQVRSNALKTNVENANRRNAALNAELDALRKEKTEALASNQALHIQLEETAQQLTSAQDAIRKADVERNNMQAMLVKKQQQMNAGREKNSKLHEFGLQLINIYEQPGLYKKVMQNEPFTQIKRVELENILQDYKDKIDEAKLGINE